MRFFEASSENSRDVALDWVEMNTTLQCEFQVRRRLCATDATTPGFYEVLLMQS